MKNKFKFDICTLINFDSSFRERFGQNFRIRNYYTEHPDVYFEFSFIPSGEMIAFIREYARSLGGDAEFTSDMRKFEIVARK